ncbi:MAG: hypothetical protein AAGI63_11280, partial [Planctomycetota bacterium]
QHRDNSDRSSQGGRQRSDDDEGSELDLQIERKLSDWFSPGPPPAEHFEELQQRLKLRASTQANTPPHRALRDADQHQDGSLRRRSILIVSSLAASALIAIASLWYFQDDNDAVVFRPRPLAMVYGDMVHLGFEPYYVCDDLQRFQDVMSHRHGQLLSLSNEGNRLMLGLSYPGGWTPETTAILFQVMDQPVVVFVDKSPPPEELILNTDGLSVRQTTIGQLSLVEVSPLDNSVLNLIVRE